MELIATAKFKKALDRAHASTAYTQRITKLVADLARSGLEVSHPLLKGREVTRRAILLVLTGNRGLCGGYNGNVQRAGLTRLNELKASVPEVSLEVSGKRGINFFKYRNVAMDERYTHFEDKPTYGEVELLADRYLESYITGKLDRLDVVYTKFFTVSRQSAVAETLLPLGKLEESPVAGESRLQYEFMPSAASILEEIVPTSFKVKLFKCFLDAAVSEQIARRVAMKAATENADDLIKSLSMTYNRARQGQITSELLDIVGGVEALNK
jgi:F-type H+-transporting ATPase subunit gamma